ncbi:MAG: hypothetical protein VXW26_17520, partial [SAR324 cluster bacterium]|nr:hypothetical protein [SAR324 cluster bacterium]
QKMVCFRSAWRVSSNGFFANQKTSGSSNMAFQMAFQTWPSRHDLPDMAFQGGLQAGTWTFKNMVL